METNAEQRFAQWIADAIEAHAGSTDFEGLPVRVHHEASDKNVIAVEVGAMRLLFDITVEFAVLLAAVE